MQKDKNKSKKSFLLIVILFVLVALMTCVLISTLKKSKTGVETSSDRIVGTDNTSLEKTLLTTNNLGSSRLTSTEAERLTTINKNLSQKKFFGAFVGVKNNKILFSAKFGYANVQLRNVFRLDSNFIVGQYQNLINDALILNLVKNGKLDLSSKVSTYIPGLKSSIKVKSLLTNSINLYAKSSVVNDISNGEANKADLKNISTSAYSKYVLANSSLKKVLIAKANKTTYAQAIDALFVENLNLQNTRALISDSFQANDVRSYKNSVESGESVQQNEVDTGDLYLNQYNLRMSLSDILLSMSGILRNRLFVQKYDHLFDMAINSEQGISSSSKVITVNTKAYGQYVSVMTNDSTGKIAVSVSNYPNKKVNVQKLNKSIFDLLN